MSVRNRGHLRLVHDAVKRAPRRDAPGFQVHHVLSATRHTLVLRGELDLASASTLAHTLARIPMDATTSLLLDLRALTFIDSTGVCSILVIHTLCAERDCNLVLIPGPARVRRVFELCGLLDYLPFADGASAGLEHSGGELEGRRRR
jgi:anti-sigma B factor antagonist